MKKPVKHSCMGFREHASVVLQGECLGVQVLW